MNPAPPPDSIATVVYSLQNKVNSITLCILRTQKLGKLSLWHCALRMNGCFEMIFGCETLPLCLSTDGWTVWCFISWKVPWDRCYYEVRCFSLKSAKYRLAAGLHPGPLRELKRSPDPLDAIMGPNSKVEDTRGRKQAPVFDPVCLQPKGRRGDGREKGVEREEERGGATEREMKGKGEAGVPYVTCLHDTPAWDTFIKVGGKRKIHI